jgi:hypothetical protein
MLNGVVTNMRLNSVVRYGHEQQRGIIGRLAQRLHARAIFTKKRGMVRARTRVPEASHQAIASIKRELKMLKPELPMRLIT